MKYFRKLNLLCVNMALCLWLCILLLQTLYSGDTITPNLNFKIYNEPYALLDPISSRFWVSESWYAQVISRSWGLFHGRNCLQAIFSRRLSDNPYAFVATTDKYFPAENWESPLVTDIKCDIYLESAEIDNTVKIEIHGNNGASDINIFSIWTGTITPNVWTTVDWNIQTGTHNYSQAARILLVVENLDIGTTNKIYFDKMRLVAGGQEYSWDEFDNGQDKWQYDSNTDVVDYSPPGWGLWACEPLTHNNVEGPLTNDLCVYLAWNSLLKTTNCAQVFHAVDWDLNNFDQIQIRARCSSLGSILKVRFDDYWGNNVVTTAQGVGSINTWETLSFNFPIGTFDWGAVKKVTFSVLTEVGDSTGEIYIDNLKFHFK